MVGPLWVLDALFDVAGPFVFPVALFVMGLVGYAVLVALGRAGLIDDGRPDGESCEDVEKREEGAPTRRSRRGTDESGNRGPR